MANVTATVRARGTGSYKITAPDGSDRLEVTPTGVNLDGPVEIDGAESVTVNDASTDSVLPVLTISRKTTGAAASGIGSKIPFYLENAAGTSREVARIETVMDDVTNGNEHSNWRLWTIKNGTLALRLQVSNDGLEAGAGISVHGVPVPDQAAHIVTVTQSANGDLDAVDLTTNGGKETLLNLVQELQTKLEALRVTVEGVGYNAAV